MLKGFFNRLFPANASSNSVEPPRSPLDVSSPLPSDLDPGNGQQPVAVLDQYVTSTPSVQNAVDIFKGEWSSQLPETLFASSGGNSKLFEDGRINWFVSELGGVAGQTVLELGPLEAGHTYMLEQFGAASIVSIEANTRAYLKCLIMKESLGLKRSQFLCGDFVEYLRANQIKFDVCVASGVLYHMRNPVELIALAAKSSDRLFIWTHYYDQKIISGNVNLAPKFKDAATDEYAGFRHTIYRQEYNAALGWAGFCGGSVSYSHWMAREEILACLRYFGLTDIRVGFEQPDHPNGPSFAITAFRR